MAVIDSWKSLAAAAQMAAMAACAIEENGGVNGRRACGMPRKRRQQCKTAQRRENWRSGMCAPAYRARQARTGNVISVKKIKKKAKEMK